MAKKNDAERLPPIHPGEILAEEMEARALSANRLARDIDVPANRISEIVAGRRNITPDTAYRLGLYFGTSARLWLNLQQRYDLLTLEATQGEVIRARIRPHAA